MAFWFGRLVFVLYSEFSLISFQSMYGGQGVAVVPPTVPGPYLGVPRGTMRKQKSIGERTHITHETRNNIGANMVFLFEGSIHELWKYFWFLFFNYVYCTAVFLS